MELLEREPLLASLRGLHADARGGAGSVVFVEGEAGAGKSVLVEAFCRALSTPVHLGYCDALDTPRVLGPLHDMARSWPRALRGPLATGDRHAVFTAFLDAIAAGGSVSVVEDAHWADDATLDLLRFAARRIAPLEALLVVTYRPEDLGADHPLRRLLGDLATTRSVHRLAVPALSEAAVRALAGARDGGTLHAVTGGNAFFVTEALRTPEQEIPATVRDAVLARVGRLDPAVRVVLDGVSLVPEGAVGALREAVVAVDPMAFDEGIRSGILVLDGPVVRFRHELARRVVEAEVPAGRAVELHGRIISVLDAVGGADPARMAFHADAAHDAAGVLRHAPAAARAAVRLGAHREAAAHYARAVRHAERVAAPVELRAELWERRAEAHENSHWAGSAATGGGDIAAAVAAAERAAELWEETGDAEQAAAAGARRALLWWISGRREEAARAAAAVAEALVRLPPGPRTGQAHAALARLRMLARDLPAAVASGTVAVAHAEEHGDTTTLAHALGVVGNALWTTEPERAAALLARSVEVARSVGNDLMTAVALGNLGAGAAAVHDHPTADRWLAEAERWCAARDLDAMRGFVRAWQARSAFDQGRWTEATAAAVEVVDGRVVHPAGLAVALTVLGRLRARRGDPDPAGPLRRAAALAGRGDDLLLLWPVTAGLAEVAWLAGAPGPVEELQRTHALAVAHGDGWAAGELGHWLGLSGVEPGLARPWARQRAGDAEGAASAWRELGLPYEAALARSAGDDPDELRAAMDDLRDLGAWPAAELVARRLRELGVRNLPRRPRRSTRENPGLLTERQAEVLELLEAGLRNVDIAARLHISAKTVDHHVSAILAKLGVGTRREAASWARDGR
ncbi:AAA family ATPase [Pseudonocardia ailaonensis]|uniref:AAA family ATPase n=1 Tax=Pseudonocardia ailaonensis TaxID=367279 RepID=A0ABN2NF77_9PSEU